MSNVFVEALNPTRMAGDSSKGRWPHLWLSSLALLWAQLLPPLPASQAGNPTSQEKNHSTNIALELQDKPLDVSKARNISCSLVPCRVTERPVLQTFPLLNTWQILEH